MQRTLKLAKNVFPSFLCCSILSNLLKMIRRNVNCLTIYTDILRRYLEQSWRHSEEQLRISIVPLKSFLGWKGEGPIPQAIAVTAAVSPCNVGHRQGALVPCWSLQPLNSCVLAFTPTFAALRLPQMAPVARASNTLGVGIIDSTSLTLPLSDEDIRVAASLPPSRKSKKLYSL